MSHWKWDILYWLVFALGQLLFLLKRADLARRSPMNGVASMGAFFAFNWVTILYRSALEFVVPFWVYRHVDVNAMIAKTGWNMPFQVPQSLVVSFVLGLFADFVMDWVAMQKSIAGIPIPSWLKENIPQLPEVKEFVEKLAEDKQAGPGINPKT